METMELSKKIEEAFQAVMKDPSQANLDAYKNLLDVKKVQDAQAQPVVAPVVKDTVITEGRMGKYCADTVSWMHNLKEAIAGRGSYASLIPTDVATAVEYKINEYGKIYARCRIHNLAGNYNFSIEGSGATVDYVAEAGAYGEATPTLNVISLGAWKLAAKVIFSEETDDLEVNMLDYIVESLARGFAEKIENEILHGTGTANSHITGCVYSLKNTTGYTDQVVTDTTAAGAFKWESLKAMMSKLGPYRNGAVLIMTQEACDHIHEFKDNNKYIFDQNAPLESIWGMPVIISDKMEAFGTDAKYPVIAANLDYYHIGLRQGMDVKVCDQTLAANGQNLVVAKMRVDGKPALAQAFAGLLTDF